MDKDIYLQVELEVYLCSHDYIKNTGNKPERVTDRAHASSFCLAAVMTYTMYVLMCSMNATIYMYDCMQMENSARVDFIPAKVRHYAAHSRNNTSVW